MNAARQGLAVVEKLRRARYFRFAIFATRSWQWHFTR
jgi:hypothetical protein